MKSSAMQAAVETTDLTNSAERRQTMVDCQIRTFDVTDQRLIARFLAVPRERFVPLEGRDVAYSDVGLTIKSEADGAEGRYLLPPLVLARLIQGGRIGSIDRVLDVACGAGYSTAILAGIAAEVVALEEPAVAPELEERLASLDRGQVRIVRGKLEDGVLGGAPYDVILINGAIEAGLEPLLDQLAEGGRLLAIRRNAADPTGLAAKAMCFEKRGAEIGTRYLFDAAAPVLRAFARTPAFSF